MTNGKGKSVRLVIFQSRPEYSVSLTHFIHIFKKNNKTNLSL